MKQRSPRATRVRIAAFVKVKTREAAAKVAGGRLAAGHATTVPKVLGEWSDGVAELRAAKPLDVESIVERLRGKPLEPCHALKKFRRGVDVVVADECPFACTFCAGRESTRVANKPLALPVADGAQ